MISTMLKHGEASLHFITSIKKDEKNDESCRLVVLA
jgi:hypothetical protein